MITVLLVRHADVDRPSASANPPLNPFGQRRAEDLARAVGAAGIASLFTSSMLRTQMTVEPLAKRLGVVPRLAPVPAAFAQQVLSGSEGAVVLVAGHSNTVPAMIAALRGVPVEIDVREFDNLFVVAIHRPDEVSVLQLKYGVPS